MKKTLSWIIGVIFGLIKVAGVIVLAFVINQLKTDEADTDSDEKADIEDAEAAAEDNDDKERDKSEKNPFGEFIEPKAMDETDFIEYIHGMSHQKVKADAKWGYYEMTGERIEWLLSSLDKANENLDNDKEEVFHDILNRWSVDDFLKRSNKFISRRFMGLYSNGGIFG